MRSSIFSDVAEDLSTPAVNSQVHQSSHLTNSKNALGAVDVSAESHSSTYQNAHTQVNYEEPIIGDELQSNEDRITVHDNTGAGQYYQQFSANHPEAGWNHAQGCQPCQQAACGQCTNCLTNRTPCFDPQEYLFDGGDQIPTVTTTASGEIHGLDAEDTVAHYEMLDGRQCVATSNRIPIYAPRFGAVRKISGTKLTERAVGPQPILSPVGPLAVVEAGLANSLAQPVSAKGEESVKLIDAFRDRNRGVPAESVLPAIPVSDAFAPLANLSFFRTGKLEEKETAVLGRLLANAQTWTVPESLAVAINGQTAIQVVDSKGAQEVYIYDIPPGGCSLRLCKAASHTTAEPGDIIQFSLRFDNIGPIPVKKAVITDSLSTRLEYIDGSQQCSLKAKFTTEENDAGSSVLKWEIDSQLKTGEGGTIQFRCRVR